MQATLAASHILSQLATPEEAWLTAVARMNDRALTYWNLDTLLGDKITHYYFQAADTFTKLAESS